MPSSFSGLHGIVALCGRRRYDGEAQQSLSEDEVIVVASLNSWGGHMQLSPLWRDSPLGATLGVGGGTYTSGFGGWGGKIDGPFLPPPPNLFLLQARLQQRYFPCFDSRDETKRK